MMPFSSNNFDLKEVNKCVKAFIRDGKAKIEQEYFKLLQQVSEVDDFPAGTKKFLTAE